MDSTHSLVADLAHVLRGDIQTDIKTRTAYSHDASLFELKPEIVVYPRDVADVCQLVRYVGEHKKTRSTLSLTARSGGTDMSGGAINDSIIVAFERYFTHTYPIQDGLIMAQPGVYYRDFEVLTLQQGLLMPSYPASRELCMMGGIVANNAGGEKSLVYGKTERYVVEVRMVLRDGQEHSFRPLRRHELQTKLNEKGLEGQIYRRLYRLVTDNQVLIQQTRPRVSKNSTAYNIWDVWDGKTFDITKLIVGSQGTLGLVTATTFRLIKAKPLSGMLVAFLPSLHNLGKVINALLPLQPVCLESFDDHTLLFAFRFFLSFRKTLGWKRFILLGLSFVPVLNKLLHYFPRLPKIVLLIEFEGLTQQDIDHKIALADQCLQALDVETQKASNKKHEEKFWTMRRESFNLLRKNVKRKHTAPFIDDLIVPPESVSEFLPRLTAILDRYQLLYTVAGHMGDGNFHIIPLMDLQNKHEREKIYPVLQEVTDLVLEYHGSLSGEHNDGLIRGPMLEAMYGPQVMEIFRQVKQAFDPEAIFNPHKKTEATLSFSKQHMRKKF